MARLDVEYTEKVFQDKNLSTASNIEQMTVNYGFKNTNDFLATLTSDIKLPQKTRNIYLYLPFKMLNILPTVNLFSNINLMNGDKYKRPFFFISRNFKDTKETLYLGKNVSLDKRNMVLNIGKNRVQLRRFVKTFYDKKMILHKQTQNININSKLSLIYMSNYNTILVVDEKTYNSTYIRLMVLEDYDRTLFEQVVTNPYAKVYKIKI
jgi:dolichyl-diphosphooligosaccharide--protein glycosyltransferase/undecaprenyl-diphosphooligosaccharide--protein glycosyltransferase